MKRKIKIQDPLDLKEKQIEKESYFLARVFTIIVITTVIIFTLNHFL